MILEKVQSILKAKNVDAWLLLNAENKDPYYQKVITPHTTIQSVALITQDMASVIVHTLDVDNLEPLKDKMNVIAYDYNNPLDKLLVQEIKNLDRPNSIALNYTTINDVNVDVLGYGFYKYVTKLLKDNIDKYKNKDPFISAENVIYALSDRKSEKDIYRLSVAAKRADQILRDSFNKIEPGMTELDLVELVHNETKIKPEYFKKEGIIEEAYSWEEESCPIALTGPSFKMGGHALSGDTKVEEGSTVYFDFGVKLTFEDGSFWSSDLQRTGYVLRKGEKKPPEEILKRFKTIIGSISEGINNIKPGMKGYEVDQIVRSYIIEKGYPDYDHGTGHSIGELAHNPGTTLSLKQNKMANLEIQPNGVYTIEPRIPVDNGVSIEEMVVVYQDKTAETLCKRQTEPILIKP